jgi:hypothetical protein
MLDTFRPFVTDTNGQIKAIHTTVGTLQATVHADLESAKTQIGEELHAIRHSLGVEIAHLTEAVGRLPRPASVPTDDSAAQHNSGSASPSGHCFDYDNRGKMCAERTSPSVGGMPPDNEPCKIFTPGSSLSTGTDSALATRVELPQFDGSNLKLWQCRYKDYF